MKRIPIDILLGSLNGGNDIFSSCERCEMIGSGSHVTADNAGGRPKTQRTELNERDKETDVKER